MQYFLVVARYYRTPLPERQRATPAPVFKAGKVRFENFPKDTNIIDKRAENFPHKETYK